MVADRSNECPNCNKNKDTIRINEWDVKGTIYVDDHFIDVSYFHWVCKNCLYMWNQNEPDRGHIFDPELNEKQLKKYKTCTGCGNPPMYCDCHG